MQNKTTHGLNIKMLKANNKQNIYLRRNNSIFGLSHKLEKPNNKFLRTASSKLSERMSSFPAHFQTYPSPSAKTQPFHMNL